jgi:hypothetical protein
MRLWRVEGRHMRPRPERTDLIDDHPGSRAQRDYPGPGRTEPGSSPHLWERRAHVQGPCTRCRGRRFPPRLRRAFAPGTFSMGQNTLMSRVKHCARELSTPPSRSGGAGCDGSCSGGGEARRRR